MWATSKGHFSAKEGRNYPAMLSHCMYSLKEDILTVSSPTNLSRALACLPRGSQWANWTADFGNEISVWPCTAQELSQLSSLPRGVIPKHSLKQSHYSCSESIFQPPPWIFLGFTVALPRTVSAYTVFFCCCIYVWIYSCMFNCFQPNKLPSFLCIHQRLSSLFTMP